MSDKFFKRILDTRYTHYRIYIGVEMYPGLNILDTRFLYFNYTLQDIYWSRDVSWFEYIGYKIYIL